MWGKPKNLLTKNMAIYIEMPKLSDTMTEGTLLKWLKAEGSKVETGDVLAEIETDKATMEMEAFDDGILHAHLVQAGGKAAVGARIGLLLQKGEAPPAAGVEVESVKSGAAKADTMVVAEERGAVVGKVDGGGDRVKASPLAKKLAKEKGVDLGGLSGSGPGGRVVAKDVEGAKGGVAKAVAVKAVESMAMGDGDVRVGLSGMRRIIAERLLASKTTIPHFYLNIEVDAGPMMKMRGEANVASEALGGEKLTVNDFILKAVVGAAVRVPEVNASFAGDSIIQYGGVHLCVAVAVEEGLVTPVIRDAQKQSLREISGAVKDLALRARGKKLKPEEYVGGTITVSNLGSYGIESFSAIINPPQAMIIAVGAIVKKPVVNAKGEIVVGQRLAIGLSADHRVVDGAVGAKYLGELRRLIESPALVLL